MNNNAIILTSADDADVVYDDVSVKTTVEPTVVPVVESKETVETAPVAAAETTATETKEENLMLVDSVSIDYEETKPVILDKAAGREILLDKLNIFSYPLAVAAELREKANKPFGSADANLTALYSPRLMFSDRLEVPGSKWVQQLHHGGTLIGVQSPRFGVSGNVVAGPAALDMLKIVS